MKKIDRLIALIIIQSLLLMNVCFAGNTSVLCEITREPAAILSPQVCIGMLQFHELFAFEVNYRSVADSLKEQNNSAAQENAKDLNDGYRELENFIIENIKNADKSLLVCIDGAVSAGKTTLADMIRDKAIAGISRDDIGFIDVDALKHDAFRKYNNYLDVIIKLPEMLDERMEMLRDKKLVVVEGVESVELMLSSSYIPDIAVILRASLKVRLKRHIMRYGLLGIKFFFENRSYDYIPQGIPLLSIATDEYIPFYEFLWQAVIKTMLKTPEYMLPEFLVDYISDNTDLLKTWINKNVWGKLKIKMGTVSIGKIVLLPLDLFFFAANQAVDLYYLFHKDMTAIIKDRFGGRHINVLDVGTGDGRFVERFQRILDEEGIEAKVVGIDIKSGPIAFGLSRKRNLKILDIANAEEVFGLNRFDLITINAPDYPELCVRKAMRVLKPDGLLVLRLAKWYHSHEDRLRLIKNIEKDFKVSNLTHCLYNLPNGLHYKLQNPLFITYKNIDFKADEVENSRGGKNTSYDSGTIYDFKKGLQACKKNIMALIKKGRLLEASQRIKLLKERGVDVDEEQAELAAVLKIRGDFFFSVEEYKRALNCYREIITISPYRTDIYFYAGASQFMMGDLAAAHENFEKARKGEPCAPMFVLTTLMLDVVAAGKNIVLITSGADDFNRAAWTGNLELFNRLMGHIDYIFKERFEDLKFFLQRSEIDALILEALLAYFIDNMDKIGEKIGDVKLAGIGLSSADISEALPRLKLLSGNRSFPIKRGARRKAVLKAGKNVFTPNKNVIELMLSAV